jgi:hypothetical protein
LKIFGAKRNIHIVLPQPSYVKTKIATFERQLTLQDTIGGFAALIAEGDDRAISILDELALLKYNGHLRERLEGGALSQVDSNLLYDMLERAET